MSLMQTNFKYNKFVMKNADLSALEKGIERELVSYRSMTFERFRKEMDDVGVVVNKPNRRSKGKRSVGKVIDEREGMTAAVSQSKDDIVQEPVQDIEAPLFPWLLSQFSIWERGFENVAPASDPPEDWETLSSAAALAMNPAFVALERRLQYILSALLDYQVPVETRKGSKASEAMYNVAEDYLDIPYDGIPDYDSIVRKPISLYKIRQQLQSHEYRSIAAFAADFYEMLSNGRSVTEPGSKVRSYDNNAIAT